MGDKGRPRSKTARSPSSSNVKGQRSISRTESTESEPEPVENTLSWMVLTREQILELLGCSPCDVLTKLCSTLAISNTHINLKNSIRADLYLLAVHFAQQHSFTETAAGGLITILHHVIARILEDKSLPEIVFESSELLTGTKDFKEAQKFDFLSTDETILISEYLQTTIFQHFSLYKCALLREQEETIISLEKIIYTCPPLGSFDPPPLAEAISDHDIEVYLNAPPPEPEAIEEEGDEEEGSEEIEKEDGGDSNPLISLGNVQTVLDTMGEEMIDKFSKDIKGKCTEKENQYMSRLGKVKKALD